MNVDRLPVGQTEQQKLDLEALTGLLRDSVIIKVVTIVDITRLSILELLEFGLTRQDISYAMTKGVIEIEKETTSSGAQITSSEELLVHGDYYFQRFLSNKVKLTTLGLYLLDCIQGCQTEQDVIEKARNRFEAGIFYLPGHPHGPA